MTTTQENIVKAVDIYKFKHPGEYAFTIKWVKQEIHKQKDGAKFNKTDLLERNLYCMPENMFKLFIKILGMEEHNYLATRKGAMWFAKQFQEFSFITKAKI